MSKTPSTPEKQKARADAQAVRERESAQAWTDHENEARAIEERTAKLRALRLAKEAQDAEEAAVAAAEAPPKKKSAAKKSAAPKVRVKRARSTG